MTLAIAIALVGAYLVGSIDFASFVARMHGVNIREVGSGNPGTSNVLRTLGKGPAAMVLVGDALKGVAGAYLGVYASGTLSHWMFATGLAAVIGHCYPLFSRFRGGKGVATGLGVLLFTVPIAGLIVLGTWAALTKLTKVAAIGSLTAVAITIPLALWQGARGLDLVWLGLTIALILWRHRSNISRMISGNEQTVTS